MRRLMLLAIAGLLVATLAATAAVAQEQTAIPTEPPPVPPGVVDNAKLIAEVTIPCPENIPEGGLSFQIRNVEGLISKPLTDPDGDGVYTASVTLPKYPPGPIEARDDIEPITLREGDLVIAGPPDPPGTGNFPVYYAYQGDTQLDQDVIELPVTLDVMCDDPDGPGPAGPGQPTTGPTGPTTGVLPATGGMDLAVLLGAAGALILTGVAGRVATIGKR